MVSRTGSGGVGGGGGGSDIDLSSYATKSWTDENYVGKEFFSSLFRAYDANGNEVLPNNTTTTIDNIKAMFGFWTEFYVSALGTGGQSTVGLRLAQLADVNVAGVTAGQVLTYSVDPTTQEGKWVPSTPQAGTDMATVWSNLAANGNQQINYSHLSGAISLSQGTITIGSASITPITSHQSLSGYATEDWVGRNYLALTGGTLTGDLGSTGKVISGFIAIELNSGGHLSGYGGYIDFHFNGSSADYTSRIIENASGQLNMEATVVVNNLYSRGYVSALSDARKKNIEGDIELTVDQIAKAPAIKFTWKDKKKPGLFAGSLAQYWQKTLPEVVQDHDGTLTLDYQVTALMAAIVTARKVEDHESRLRRLEKMFALNENDIKE